MEEQPAHFKGKDAIGHLAEVQTSSLIASAELHGVELSGHSNAAADAARETAVLLVMLTVCFMHFAPADPHIFGILAIFCLGWLFWKIGRSAWLGWSRLERLHRILAQERWEIQHHRQQEREELRVLYGAKGFEGQLLEDVLDVLMADNERLLKIMIEEEMGLSLESQEHPLKQGIGAGIGTILVSAICLFGWWIAPPVGLYIGALLSLLGASAFTAKIGENRLIPAMAWNLGIGIVATGSLYFLLEFLKG